MDMIRFPNIMNEINEYKMADQKNLIIALILSVGILVGFHYIYEAPRQERIKQEHRMLAEKKAQEAAQSGIVSPTNPTGATPGVSTPTLPQVQQIVSRDEALKLSKRVTIDTPHMKGSINLKGGFIDDITLKDYKVVNTDDSPLISLFSPQGAEKPYYADFGWVAGNHTLTSLPSSETIWTSTSETLVPNQPITLSWENGQGLRFERLISVDDQYLFTITQKVINNTTQNHILYPYGLISRTGTPTLEGAAILHEGFLGVYEGKYKETDYKDALKKSKVDFDTKGGWMGITDKYWLVALAPENDKTYKSTINHTVLNNQDKYQTDYLGPDYNLAPNQSIEHKTFLFSGAKKLKILAGYADTHNIERFDLAIDFGWLYFLTKPLFYLLDFLHSLIGNFGLCILGLTILVRLALFPLANNSYKTFSKMRYLNPEITRLKERYGTDRMKMNQELMALYKREKINPMAGCLPILIQIPVFFALYKVLYISIEMRHAPFFGWIHDLSMPDPTSIINLFGLLPFEPFFTLGAWPIVMGITMFLQQKLNPQPTDATQAKIMAFLPLIFTFVCANFPSGLVIYWTWGNMLSILQQWAIMKKYKPKLTKETLSHLKAPKNGK
ncbi:MAG: membrane protein insertase YidC [Alphaproteobacteria bacterium]|nr:membrane protein insertase YidC [Alphaproteobacteria bacterium]